ncbi:MAG TPA: LLM class flavin-dependent oxidoreductase [Streptosporangiaceae bacterium]|nr:LLM class flavin-dependent oxidoreductase [Streptosporangiaceae bacterium]
MTTEIIGMVGTKEVSESRGSFDGPPVDPGYLARFAQAHEAAGFDRVLIGYHATGPDGFAVAAHVLNATTRLKVLIAHRPGFVAPTLVARKLATLDQLTGGGRVAIHHITGGDELDQKRDGDFADHDRRYARTAEFMGLLRRELTATEPFDHDGEFYRVRGAYSYVKPATAGAIPLYFGGASPAAISVGAQHADVYMLWGEPVAQIAARVAGIRAEAARHGRTVRFSLSVRPIVGQTEEAAWQRAEEIRAATETRVAGTRGPQIQGTHVQGTHVQGTQAQGTPAQGIQVPDTRGPPAACSASRILLGRLGAAPAAGGRAGGARRAALVRSDPADRARRQLHRSGRHRGAGRGRPDGLPPGGRGHCAHPRLRPAGRRGRVGPGTGAVAARGGRPDPGGRARRG